jgi:hypothetical protein
MGEKALTAICGITLMRTGNLRNLGNDYPPPGAGFGKQREDRCNAPPKNRLRFCRVGVVKSS